MIEPTYSKIYQSIKELERQRLPNEVVYEWDIAYRTQISRRRIKWVCRVLYWTGWIQGSRDLTKTSLGNIVRSSQ